jgi:hypothetical protein
MASITTGRRAAARERWAAESQAHAVFLLAVAAAVLAGADAGYEGEQSASGTCLLQADRHRLHASQHAAVAKPVDPRRENITRTFATAAPLPNFERHHEGLELTALEQLKQRALSALPVRSFPGLRDKIVAVFAAKARAVPPPAGGVGPAAATAQPLGAETVFLDRAWFGAVFSAIVAAFYMSSDDFVWLTPFLVTNTFPTGRAIFYVFCMELVVFAAWALVAMGGAVKEARPGLPVEFVLNAVSAALLLFYTVILFRDWWLGLDEEEEEEEEWEEEAAAEVMESDVAQVDEDQPESEPRHDATPPMASTATTTPVRSPRGSKDDEANAGIVAGDGQATPPESAPRTLCASGVKAEDSVIDEAKAALETDIVNTPRRSPRRRRDMMQLFIISMVGSLDNFAVYVSLMNVHVFSGGQLFIGVLINSLLVVAICRGMSKVKVISEAANAIPLWCIVGGLSIWALCNVVF